MLIWGKVIGFILGYLVLGPIGAAIGLLAGHGFDRGLGVSLISKERAIKIQTLFFRATFLAMGHIAKSDGRVSEDEIDNARVVMNQLELNEAEKLEAIHLFNQGKAQDFNLTTVMSDLKNACQGRMDILYLFIEIQLAAALVDGPLKPEERKILLRLCGILAFRQGVFEAIHQRLEAEQVFSKAYARQSSSSTQIPPKGQLEQAYKILGVNQAASKAEIKKAYRKLMSQHHPDKLHSKGVPQAMIKLAKEKTQQITSAYQLICKERQFR